MITITKSFDFDCAHLLYGHDGNCANVHGHTYHLLVEAVGKIEKSGPSKGMIVDFGNLKKLVKSTILDKFDHAFIYDKTNPEESEIGEFLNARGMKVLPLPHRSTAELMSKYICQLLNEELLFDESYKIRSVTLYETPTSFAKYIV